MNNLIASTSRLLEKVEARFRFEGDEIKEGKITAKIDSMKKFRGRVGLLLSILTFLATIVYTLKLVSKNREETIIWIHLFVTFSFFFTDFCIMLLLYLGLVKIRLETVTAFHLEFNLIGNFLRCLHEGGVFAASYHVFTMIPMASFFLVSKKFGIFVGFQTILINATLFIFTLGTTPPVLTLSQTDSVFHFLLTTFILCYLADKYESERQHHLEEIKSSASRLVTATEEKASFVSTMSHELRTPIHAIVASAELLQESDLEKEQEMYVCTIRSCAQSLSATINNILEYGKLQTNKVLQENSYFDLFDLLQEIVDTHATSAEKKRIGLILRVHPSVNFSFQTVYGDKDRLRQIIVNILSNAVKFTERGLVELFVATKFQKNENADLYFKISDTGCGMSHSFIQKLFQPFVQENNSISRQFEGTGMGLCIAQNFVKILNGRGIRVTSTVGKGSTFEFEVSLKVLGERLGSESNESLFLSGQSFLSPSTAFSPSFQINNIKERNPFHVLKSLQNEPIKFIAALNRSFLSKNFAEHINNWGFYLECVDPYESYEFILKRMKEGYILVIDDDLTILKFIIDRANFGRVLHFTSLILAPNVSNIIKTNTFVNVLAVSKPVGPKKLIEAIMKVKQGFGESIHQKTDSSVNQAKSVLIVEDNKINMLLMKHFLSEKLSVVCHSAENGAEAVDLFKHHKFDLILMDIHMPTMDGITATKEIRKLEKELFSSRTPIFVMSQSTEEEEQAYQAGGDYFLTKPVNFDSIRPTILEYLR